MNRLALISNLRCRFSLLKRGFSTQVNVLLNNSEKEAGDCDATAETSDKTESDKADSDKADSAAAPESIAETAADDEAANTKSSVDAKQIQERVVLGFYERVACSDSLIKNEKPPLIDFSVEFKDRYEQSQIVKQRFNDQMSVMQTGSSSRMQSARIRRLLRSGVAVGPKWTLQREFLLLTLLQKHEFSFPVACQQLNCTREGKSLVTTRGNAGPVRWVLQPVTVVDCLEKFVKSFSEPYRWSVLLNLFSHLDQNTSTMPVDDLTFLKIVKLSGPSTAKSPLFQKLGAEKNKAEANSSIWTWIATLANMPNEAEALKRLKALVSSKKLDLLITQMSDWMQTLPERPVFPGKSAPKSQHRRKFLKRKANHRK